ncbi:ThiF family adenylyltransferase, partial [Streptococcus parasanguinis]
MLEKEEIFQMYFDEIPLESLESEDKECYFYQYKKFTLKIIVSNDFPHSLPEIYLSNYMDFNKWYSHVGSEGKLCYISDDNLIWDFNNPSGLLKDCCEKVKELLDSWDTPKMTEDLRKEFLSYWHISCLKSKTKYIDIQSYLSRVSTFEKHELVLSNQKYHLFNYGSQLKESVAPQSKKSRDVYILPLKDSNSVIPPNPLNELTEATFKKLITGNLSSGVRRRFQKWCKTKRKSFILILSLPISDNDYVLFGASFESGTSKYPFKIDNKVPQKNKDRKRIGSKAKKSKNGSFKITPVYVTRFDKEYRVSRTSQEYDFLNKKVVIIGLGSVGSFVANNLSKMGIEKLLLIDPDFLTVDNISRHYLGMDSIIDNIQKVDALEDRLKKENPDLEIECEGIRFQEIVRKNPNLFCEYDFVFSC